MTLSFNGKRILVTGGTRGIGKEIVLAFANTGAEVIATGRSETAPSWMDSYPAIRYEQLDLESSDWQRDVQRCLDRYETIDVCINNAGINKVSKIEALEPEDLDRILRVNLNAPIYIASLVAKKMIPTGSGHILNIGSIFGSVSRGGRNPYTASKAGLIGATKTMAIDLGPHGILVNCLSPGFIETELTRNVLGESGIREVEQRIPLQRLGRPKDLVPVILFLCSDLNTYLTGQNIIVDGGFTLE